MSRDKRDQYNRVPEGVERLKEPRRCREGHLVLLWPCQICKHNLARAEALRKQREADGRL